ncbi:MAG: hypothetical protein ACK5KT_12300 [Dysgonomonas sp.]
MTRQNFTKGLALAFMAFLIIYACTSEQDYIINDRNTQQAEPLTTADAQAWYEQNFGIIPHLKSGGDEEPPVLMPDWNLSHLYQDSLWYAVESPLNAPEHAGVNLMTMDVSQYVEAQGDKSLARQVLRLIVLRNKEDGTTYSFMMAVIPDLDYMLEKGESIEENKYLNRESDLSGLVYFYTVDGQFVNGWMYEDGKIIGGTHFEDNAGGTKVSYIMRTDRCWFQDTFVRGELVGTSYHCESSYEVIFRHDLDGGGGSGGGVTRNPVLAGGGGSGNNLPIIQEEPNKEESTDPCENIKNKVTTFSFGRMMQELRGLTTKNYEAGRSYTYDNGKYTFTNRDGNPGEPDIKYNPTPAYKIDGFIHTHYDGTLRTFSPSDLMIPYDWFMNKNGINNLNTFSLGLVTSDGTYFLFVTDLQQYMAFGKKYQSEISFNNLGWIYDELYGINTNLDADASMKALTKFLNESASGLTLMKDIGNSKYSKVTIDKNGNVKIINCG